MLHLCEVIDCIASILDRAQTSEDRVLDYIRKSRASSTRSAAFSSIVYRTGDVDGAGKSATTLPKSCQPLPIGIGPSQRIFMRDKALARGAALRLYHSNLPSL